MNRYIKALGSLFLAGVLAACGGGGGSAGGDPTDPTDPTAPEVASIDVFTSASELQSASNSSISFTVLPKDANNQVIPNQSVTFAATSGNISGALPAPTTGPDGVPITGVTLSPGENRANRNIIVTVAAGSVSQQVVIPVVGTNLALSGDSFVAQGSTISYTVRATDSADSPIPNAPLVVRSRDGNTISPSSLTTNSQGVATFNFTGTRSGSDIITVTGLGTSDTANVSVSADEFKFVSPQANTTVNVNTNRTVVVEFVENGLPVSGRRINFSTTRGTITASDITGADGRASAVVRSASAGPATIVAQTGTAQVTLQLNYLATAPSVLELQANPSAVGPNDSGSANNQAALSAIVRDASGNPVAGKVVSFTAVRDPSSGTISPATAMTGSNGIATSQFIPGALTTANNGVVIKATVQGTTVSGTTSLTVNTQALFIALSTGNQITNVPGSQTTYEKEFAVQVTDANGAAVANKSVTLAVVPQTYAKGFLEYRGGSWKYNAASFMTCPNEDTNRNGRLDAGEDINGNGTLQPGGPVSLSRATVTTDATGLATFTVQYGENFAPWIEVQIAATTTVGGTESSASMNYVLLGADGDFTNSAVPPSGRFSPFGTVPDCTSPN